MPATPDVAPIAALIGDPARARILTYLLDGRAFTASELARAAGVTKQTTSTHLSRLLGARLVAVESQGRHRYFRLADADVGAALESLMGLANRVGAHLDAGPPEPALRKARVCYDHLAGDLGILVFDSLIEQGCLHPYKGGGSGTLALTDRGEQFARDFGIDVDALRRHRRQMCRACLDWSERRRHLAGSLGAAILRHCFDLGWARRQRGSAKGHGTRAIYFSTIGERALRSRFTLRGR